MCIRDRPFIVATTAKKRKGAIPWLELKRTILEQDAPLCLVFGTSWGLADEIFNQVDAVLDPILGGYGEYNHLSVRSAVAVALDRFFGSR